MRASLDKCSRRRPALSSCAVSQVAVTSCPGRSNNRESSTWVVAVARQHHRRSLWPPHQPTRQRQTPHPRTEWDGWRPALFSALGVLQSRRGANLAALLSRLCPVASGRLDVGKMQVIWQLDVAESATGRTGGFPVSSPRGHYHGEASGLGRRTLDLSVAEPAKAASSRGQQASVGLAR